MTDPGDCRSIDLGCRRHTKILGNLVRIELSALASRGTDQARNGRMGEARPTVSAKLETMDTRMHMPNGSWRLTSIERSPIERCFDARRLTNIGRSPI